MAHNPGFLALVQRFQTRIRQVDIAALQEDARARPPTVDPISVKITSGRTGMPSARCI